jgi:hypothetical protein
MTRELRTLAVVLTPWALGIGIYAATRNHDWLAGGMLTFVIAALLELAAFPPDGDKNGA